MSLETTNGPDFREHYANSVQMRYSLWDFFVIFGTVTQVGNDAGIQNFQGVYMSPQHTKALAKMLQANVDRYEATFGPINQEPQQAPEMQPSASVQ